MALKFPAEVKSYQIINRAEGKIAVIRLEVPESKVEESYFMGGMVKNYLEFEVHPLPETRNIEE